MNISIKVDHVILDGVDLSSDESRQVRRDVARQLTALLDQQKHPSAICENIGSGILDRKVILAGLSPQQSPGQQLGHEIYKTIDGDAGRSGRDFGGPKQ